MLNKKLFLPEYVVQFLIDEYAFNPARPVKLKISYISFKDIFSEYKKIFENVAASYIVSTKTIYINTDTLSNSTLNLIETIIHEIHHYNQHMMWNYSLSFRKSWVSDFALPDGFSINNLHKLSFFNLIEFWSRHYEYKNAPHEFEAIKWASENLKNAVHKIYENFVEIDTNIKDTYVRNNNAIRV